jgi:hypothetical protein
MCVTKTVAKSRPLSAFFSGRVFVALAPPPLKTNIIALNSDPSEAEMSVSMSECIL